MFYWRSTISTDGASPREVDVAFTGRSAGLGGGSFQGLNLGGHVGDDLAHVEANRVLLAHELGLPRERLLFMNQVHGTQVVAVEASWPAVPPPEADAVVTRTSDLALAVLVADCVPVLLHDAHAGVIGAVHAGRPGMTAGIIGRALEAMRDLGASDVRAVVGPSVCGRCYEVPSAMAAAAAAVVPEAAARSWSGTPAIDVAAGVVAQLAGEGVGVDWVPGCSREVGDLYSYRRDGVTGRFAGVVVLRSADS